MRVHGVASQVDQYMSNAEVLKQRIAAQGGVKRLAQRNLEKSLTIDEGQTGCRWARVKGRCRDPSSSCPTCITATLSSFGHI